MPRNKDLEAEMGLYSNSFSIQIVLTVSTLRLSRSPDRSIGQNLQMKSSLAVELPQPRSRVIILNVDKMKALDNLLQSRLLCLPDPL